VRQDKADALREKLRRGAQRFEFDALIQGVSTLDDETESSADEPKTPEHAAPMSRQPAPAAAVAAETSSDHEGLSSAVDTLGKRLLEEAGKLRSAFAAGDVQDSGYYLARVNHVLELLLSVDPRGDVSRRYQASTAPPPGRTWPSPCWTLYDFAESPLSGLLPPNADDTFAAHVVEVAVQTSEG